MNDPIIFAMANPEPEITYQKAKAAGARVVGTGRSDYPNQINNVLSFPWYFQRSVRSKSSFNYTRNESQLLLKQSLIQLVMKI